MSATKLFATTDGLINFEGVLCYETFYKYVPVLAGVDSNVVHIPVAIGTETEANTAIQQAIVDLANIEPIYGGGFTVDDVRGGRI